MSDVKTLGVVGAGPMGQGIAQIGLQSGLNVVLYDLNREALEKSAATMFGFIQKLEDKGKLEPGATESAKARLKLADGVADFAPCEAVIEAIIERLEPKQSLFAELEGVVAPDAIIASNTSSLSVAEIAAGCKTKDRICGLHFFNPVPLMRLVEVVVAPGTSQEVADRAVALSHKIGKDPVVVKDGPGFLVNLQGRALPQEGLQIVQDGVSDPGTVDRIMRDAMNFRMGPFELMDLTGIDVNFPASTYIYEGYQHDPRLKTTTLHALMRYSGNLGRKTGSGFFDYSGDAGFPTSPEASANPPSFSPRIGEASADLDALGKDVGWTEGSDVTLIAPIGEDCSTACARLGLDPKTTVAVDCTARTNMHLTVMAAPGGGELAAQVADWLRSKGFKVEAIKDSPGFVLQRILGMIANLGCELAQIGVGTPADIDLAMKLAQNYPKGPMEIADWLGLEKLHTIMRTMQEITGSDRYRPALWLRRRAMLGLSVYTAD
ncbi:MAG: 3-hydroxyacyl-CoA dehydrogenase [Novosphingobium sp.]|nr:3-hydroxyacyl-CoA dehydrogenase [Novosphingobium sp.]